MSFAPLPEPPCSASFDDDLNVLVGFAETYGFEPPVVRFGEDVWDFSAVPDRPAYLPAYCLVVRFDRITQPRWRLMVKELLCARLYPSHPAVASSVPNHRRRPAPLGEAYARVLLYKRWLDWLAERGITSLGEVRQEHCDRYYNIRAGDIAPSALSAMVILPLRELADYGPVLTDRYPDGFRPWGTPAALPHHRPADTQAQRDTGDPSAGARSAARRRAVLRRHCRQRHPRRARGTSPAFRAGRSRRRQPGIPRREPQAARANAE